jgi:hypothetical protein
MDPVPSSEEAATDVAPPKLKLLVITCWCGGQSYADMTSKMIDDLAKSIPDYVDWCLGIFRQGVPDDVTLMLPPGVGQRVENASSVKNLGFARGMNGAYQAGTRYFMPDYVLCINNDMEMPHIAWLHELFQEFEPRNVLCPTTNYTSVNEQREQDYKDEDPRRHGVTPGMCWLMDMSTIDVLEEHLGEGKLFPEDLPGRAWGEDNYVAGLMRTKINPVPFKIVPRAWIRHLGAKTSSVIPSEEKMACHREAHRRMKAENFK